MAAYFYLASELDRPEEIGSGLQYLDGSPEALTALELLLGTQASQRPRLADVPLLAKSDMQAGAGFARSNATSADESPTDSTQTVDRGAYFADYSFQRPELAPPVLLSNRADLITASAPVASHVEWEYDREFLGRCLLWGGTLLALGALFGALMLRASARRLFGSRVGHLPIRAIVGAMWISGIPMSTGRVAMAPEGRSRTPANDVEALGRTSPNTDASAATAARGRSNWRDEEKELTRAAATASQPQRRGFSPAQEPAPAPTEMAIQQAPGSIASDPMAMCESEAGGGMRMKAEESSDLGMGLGQSFGALEMKGAPPAIEPAGPPVPAAPAPEAAPASDKPQSMADFAAVRIPRKASDGSFTASPENLRPPPSRVCPTGKNAWRVGRSPTTSLWESLYFGREACCRIGITGPRVCDS